MRIGVLKKRRVALVAALVVSSQGWVWAVATNAASNQTVPPAPRFSTNTLISARIKWNLDLFGSQTNYSYFAGKPAFELMVQTAQKQLTTRQ